MALSDAERQQVLDLLDALDDAVKEMVLASLDTLAEWLSQAAYSIYVQIKGTLQQLWSWLRSQF